MDKAFELKAKADYLFYTRLIGERSVRFVKKETKVLKQWARQ